MPLNHSVLEVSHLSAGYLHNNHAHFLISDLSFSLRRGAAKCWRWSVRAAPANP